VAKRCCTRFAPEIWPAIAAPNKVAKRCCTNLAPEIWRAMLHHKVGQTIATQKGLLHDAAQDSAQRSGHRAKKVAERWCTRFALGIWRAMLHHKVDQMIAAQQGQPEDSARRLGQQTAAPKRWPKCVAQDLPQRSGQQSRARWGDSSRHSWEINPGTFSQICFPAVGRLIPAHFPSNQNAAQDLPPRSCQQLLHQKGG
jgi:hypothetical protein